MDDYKLEVTMIDFESRAALRNDGKQGVIEVMLDNNGMETDEYSEASALVISWPDDLMSTMFLNQWQQPTLH